MLLLGIYFDSGSLPVLARKLELCNLKLSVVQCVKKQRLKLAGHFIRRSYLPVTKSLGSKCIGSTAKGRHKSFIADLAHDLNEAFTVSGYDVVGLTYFFLSVRLQAPGSMD
jgi:hypothetical protein